MYAPLPQTFGSQQPTYGAPYNQPFSQPMSNSVPTHTGQSSILNPQPVNTFAPGIPPIEVAQSALQQQIQRNPTPPPGWNDPPAIKSARAVSKIGFNFNEMYKTVSKWMKLHSFSLDSLRIPDSICVNSFNEMNFLPQK